MKQQKANELRYFASISQHSFTGVESSSDIFLRILQISEKKSPCNSEEIPYIIGSI